MLEKALISVDRKMESLWDKAINRKVRYNTLDITIIEKGSMG